MYLPVSFTLVSGTCPCLYIISSRRNALARNQTAWKTAMLTTLPPVPHELRKMTSHQLLQTLITQTSTCPSHWPLNNVYLLLVRSHSPKSQPLPIKPTSAQRVKIPNQRGHLSCFLKNGQLRVFAPCQLHVNDGSAFNSQSGKGYLALWWELPAMFPSYSPPGRFRTYG